ncbi:hypothetical protein [Cupriavidus sp. TMH.W2]|uniref:hypothetical protein n=1 Tax=Cupriavidus sp. TMH.W2 TaxID=3434465 RepID=UPI003D781DBC
MSPIFKVGGKFLAFGLNWRAFTGAKAEKEAKARAKEDEVPYIVCLKDEEGGRFGYLKDFDTEATGGRPKKGSLMAGAALLATLPDIAENAMFIHPYKPLGGEHRVAAVVTLYRGKIFEDRANIRATEVQDHLDKVIQMLVDSAATDAEDSAPQFKLYTTDPAHFPDAEHVPLDALLDGQHAAAGVVDARSYLAFRLTMIAVILACGGYLGWGEWEDYQQRQQLAARPAQQGPSPAELYQQSLNAALRQIGVKPEAFAAIALKTMGERETTVAGYELQATACNDAGVCTEEWNRTGVGVLEDFVAANEGAKIDPSSDGNSLKLTYRMALPRIAATRQQMPTGASFLVPLQSLLQRYAALGLATKTQPQHLIALPSGMQENSVPAGIGVAAAEIQIDGPSGFLRDLLSNEAMPELRLPDNVYVSEVGYKVSGPVGATTFTLKGNYYVQQ